MPTIERKLRVFLSYAREDKETVHEIYRRLNNEEWIEPWQDISKILPGETWALEIRKAIDQADVIIIILSENSVIKEGFIHTEMHYAWNRSLQKPPGTIFLIPMRLEDCKVPIGLYDLEAKQWVDYFDEEKEVSYAKLLKSLEARLEQRKILETRERALTKKRKEIKTRKEKIELEATEKARKIAEKKVLKEKREATEKDRDESYMRRLIASEEEVRIEGQDDYLRRLMRSEEKFRNKPQKNRTYSPEIPLAPPLKSVSKQKKLPYFIVSGIAILFIIVYLIGKAPDPLALATVERPLTEKTTIVPTQSSATIAFTPTSELDVVFGLGSTMVSPIDGMALLYIPAGEFEMGSNAEEALAECQRLRGGCEEEWFMDAEPIHTVTVDAYWIDRNEVTNAMFSVFLNEADNQRGVSRSLCKRIFI